MSFRKVKKRPKRGPQNVLDFFRAPERAIKAIETPVLDHELKNHRSLEHQLNILDARHLFVAQSKAPNEIADQLKIKRSTVMDWISRYGWRAMRNKRSLMRELGLMVKYELTTKALEQQQIDVLTWITDAVEDKLQQARDGDLVLTPAEIQICLATAVKCHEAHLMIHQGNSRPDTRRVEFTETVKRMISVEDIPKQLPDSSPHQVLQIEDAEFDRVDA